MLIGIRKGFVFIANSKSASTSIEALLGPHAEVRATGSPQMKHMAWTRAQREYGHIFRDPETSPERFLRFGVVRNPLDWVRSWYNYRSGKRGLPGALPPGTTLEDFWRMDDWLKRRRDGRKRLQKQAFCDADGECRFDIVVPYERLDDALPAILQSLGIPFAEVPKKNVSPEGVAAEAIDPALAREIEEYYGEDLAFHASWKERLPGALEGLKTRPRMDARVADRQHASWQGVAPLAPLNFKSVLIVTYGRSGSTLLQGLLNSIDGVLVRGENNNFLYSLFDAYKAIADTRSSHGGKDAGLVSNPWFGAHILDERKFMRQARALVRAQLLGPVEPSTVRCLGFKEIRYVEKRVRLVPYLEFLSRLFPKPAFIVLTRDLDEVLKSAWWSKRDEEAAREGLKRFELTMASYAGKRDWTFPITYRDLVDATPRLRAMFEFLGAPYQPEIVQRVLATPHSFDSGRPQAVIGQGVRCLKTPCHEIAQFVFDSTKVSADARISLGGVLVLKSAIQPEFRLVARDAEGEKRVEWGLPSSRYARKHPDNPNAARARFSVEGLMLPANGSIKVLLASATGETREIAVVQRMEPAADRSAHMRAG